MTIPRADNKPTKSDLSKGRGRGLQVKGLGSIRYPIALRIFPQRSKLPFIGAHPQVIDLLLIPAKLLLYQNKSLEGGEAATKFVSLRTFG